MSAVGTAGCSYPHNAEPSPEVPETTTIAWLEGHSLAAAAFSSSAAGAFFEGRFVSCLPRSSTAELSWSPADLRTPVIFAPGLTRFVAGSSGGWSQSVPSSRTTRQGVLGRHQHQWPRGRHAVTRPRSPEARHFASSRWPCTSELCTSEPCTSELCTCELVVTHPRTDPLNLSRIALASTQFARTAGGFVARAAPTGEPAIGPNQTQYGTRARYCFIARAAKVHPTTVSTSTTIQCRSSWSAPSRGARTMSR